MSIHCCIVHVLLVYVILLQTIWMLINIGLFVGYFVQFQTSDRYFYMRQRTKVSITFTVLCSCSVVQGVNMIRNHIGPDCFHSQIRVYMYHDL